MGLRKYLMLKSVMNSLQKNKLVITSIFHCITFHNAFEKERNKLFYLEFHNCHQVILKMIKYDINVINACIL